MITYLVEKHEKKVVRILEMVPGLLTWTVILSPIWLSLIYPPAIIFLLLFLTIYWSYLAVFGTIGGFVGYKKYKREMGTDWMNELKELNFKELPDKKTLPKTLKNVQHIILIPAVNEPKEVIGPAIDSIFKQTFPKNQITLVYTLEEKYAEEEAKMIREMVKKKKGKLRNFQIYVHPAGIEGEAIGAAAGNRTWGGKHSVQHLKDTGENIRNYIFTTIDSDHVLDPQYIARLTHLYLTSDKRDNRYYSSAIYTFNNNNWEVPTLMRIEANFVTLGTLADWGMSGKEATTKHNFSAYSTSLQTLIDADFWDPSVGVDDTIFYWRAFFARDGDFVGTPHYIPFSADAVKGKTYWDSYRSLYKQLLRWGYGVMDFPLSMRQLLTNKKVPLSKKVLWTIKHLRNRVLLINIAFLITFGFAIATVVNPNLRQTNFAYSLPTATSVILTFTMFFLIPGFWIRSKITKSMPKHWPPWRKFLTLLEGPLVLVNLLTYSFIPYVDAQTRLMLGKKMKDLYHTPKVRNYEKPV
jgi:cellulose synthase/poly-beta-1,6-N-acetylglucosamine synthase-like glycosyltransferase